METRCLFGVFVFGSNSALIYRFLTKDLFAHLHQRFLDRGYRFDEENGELSLSIDDAIVQHFSILINLYAQTSERHSAIRRISLESGIEIFFDQVSPLPFERHSLSPVTARLDRREQCHCHGRCILSLARGAQSHSSTQSIDQVSHGRVALHR